MYCGWTSCELGCNLGPKAAVIMVLSVFYRPGNVCSKLLSFRIVLYVTKVVSTSVGYLFTCFLCIGLEFEGERSCIGSRWKPDGCMLLGSIISSLCSSPARG